MRIDIMTLTAEEMKLFDLSASDLNCISSSEVEELIKVTEWILWTATIEQKKLNEELKVLRKILKGVVN